jgi:L-serine kinase (ADP)
VAARKKIILKIKPTADLKAHEETVDAFSIELASKIRREGIQRDPILVDERSGVVLDGMHRLAAFKRIGVPNIVVCSIDYDSPGVKLFRWCRAVSKPSKALFDGLKRELRLSDLPSEIRGDEGRSSTVVVMYRGKAYRSNRRTPMKDVPDAIRRFDRVVAQAGRTPEFLDEASLREAVKGDALILVTPKFQKRHVIQAGRTGALLPPKSTLHVFPLRPLGIDYPLENLVPGTDDIDRHLAGRKQKTLDGPASHGGRLYRERLLVFE